MTALGIALAFAPALAGPPGNDAAWEELRNDVVKVECTEVESVPWCRSTGLVGAPIDSVSASLRDMAAHQDKFEAVSSIRVLEPGLLHITLDYPALLSDRDYVARYAFRTEGDRQIYSWTAAKHADAPPVKGVVRLPDFAGSWTLEPSGVNTRVTYTWHGDSRLPQMFWHQAWKKAGHEALKDLALANGTKLLSP